MRTGKSVLVVIVVGIALLASAVGAGATGLLKRNQVLEQLIIDAPEAAVPGLENALGAPEDVPGEGLGPPDWVPVGPPEDVPHGPPDWALAGKPDWVPDGPPDETPVGPPDWVTTGPPDETPVGPPDWLPFDPPVAIPDGPPGRPPIPLPFTP